MACRVQCSLHYGAQLETSTYQVPGSGRLPMDCLLAMSELQIAPDLFSMIQEQEVVLKQPSF